MQATAESNIIDLQEEIKTKALTPRQLVWRRFLRHKMAAVGAIMLILLVIYSFGGALIYSEEYANHTDTSIRLQPPSLEHPFGTDTVGRDILARTIYGGQISLMIGFFAVVVQVIVGVLIGATAGYYGGGIDGLLMRFTEAMFNIPQLFLLLVMAKFFGGKIDTIELFGRSFSGSVIVIIVIIGITSWMYLATDCTGQFLISQRAGICPGCSHNRLIKYIDHFPAYPPQQHCSHCGLCHPGGSWCNHFRSLYQLFRIRCTASYSHLGQYARRFLQLY